MFYMPDAQEVGLMAWTGWLGAWFIFSFRDSGSVLLDAVEEQSVCVCVCVCVCVRARARTRTHTLVCV